MIGRVKTASLNGIDACGVEVEAHVRGRQHRMSIIGLGDSAVREAKDRVLSALAQCGLKVAGEILVNLSPAELRKEGSLFDLPIAVAIMIAGGVIPPSVARNRIFFGELALDGRVKAVRGTIALVINAVQRKLDEVVIPLKNAGEASLIPGIRVTAIESLAELVSYLNGKSEPQPISYPTPEVMQPASYEGFSDVWGQFEAKRALTVAAAGGHNVLMIGPPGCGKSMLAERFPSVLPPLTNQEKLECIKIHSIAGLPVENLLGGERPYRNPHHLVSDAGLIGGGAIPRPGEITLAHNGVLFLDEFPEFKRPALEALRQPLESGWINISRAKTNVRYPANFQLLAAMNPCPCGRLGANGQACMCSRASISTYLKKLSQPILDRIDLHIELTAVPVESLGIHSGSREIAKKDDTFANVARARTRQLERQGKLNSLLSGEELSSTVELSAKAANLMKRLTERSGLSARAYVRILRVAVTLADLKGEAAVQEEFVAEAAGFRSLERIQQYCQAA